MYKVIFGLFMTSLCSFAHGMHYITEAELNLLSDVRIGCFRYTEDLMSLIAWSDKDGVYDRCGISDISSISKEDLSALMGDVKQMAKSQHASIFLDGLKRSGLSQEVQNKIIVIAYASFLDSQ